MQHVEAASALMTPPAASSFSFMGCLSSIDRPSKPGRTQSG